MSFQHKDFIRAPKNGKKNVPIIAIRTAITTILVQNLVTFEND